MPIDKAKDTVFHLEAGKDVDAWINSDIFSNNGKLKRGAMLSGN